ncbi:MAG: hypothetical protein NT133_19390 [Alphaproteobacteria bacterium]|nr:hypothetical protein [Alphaproteobacteria bacterium]
MQQGALFPEPATALSDAEITDVLRRAIARSGVLPRSVELHLNSIAAEYLVAELRAADLEVIRSRSTGALD